jgi:hypothetical protein
MTSRERARTFLQAHIGQAVSMDLLEELTKVLENHLGDETQKRESIASDGIRVVPDLDEEVDDDPTE